MSFQHSVITPCIYKADIELFRESRAALSIPKVAVFLNDYDACDAFDIRERVSEVSVTTVIMQGVRPVHITGLESLPERENPPLNSFFSSRMPSTWCHWRSRTPPVA